MFMGLTIVNIGGVLLATWVGQTIGWRMSFLAIAVLGVVTMFSLWKALPVGAVGQKPDVKMELKVLTRLPVILALLTTVFGASAMFTLYTYIAPSLVAFNHASPMFITMMLVLIGVGFSIGNHLGGKLADRSIDKTLIGFFIALIVLMAVFPLLAQTQVGTAVGLVLWGAAAFAIVPSLQMRVMSVAHEASGLASSVNIGAFNLGNAVGAAAGGAVLSLGLSYASVSMIGAALAAIGLLLVFIQIFLASRSKLNYQHCTQT
jgi:MFS transporter, DHA1 family, inner membrane transport protein